MYCIYSTQSRCRAQNPAAAPKILLSHSNCVHLYVHTENALKMRIHFNFAGNTQADCLQKRFFYVYTSLHTPRCRAQAPPAGLRTPLPRWHNINKGMHFFLALFFKIFFIFIFFQHIIYVRRWNGGVKCRCLVGFYMHSSYSCRFFPARRLSKSAAEPYFLTWRGLSGSGKAPAVGAVFFALF